MTLIQVGGDLGVNLSIAEGTVAATTTATYKYFNMASEDYRYAFIAYNSVSNNTLTLEASNNDPKTADSDATWTDVTDALTGSASATTDGAWILDTPQPYSRMRVKIYSSDTTNTANLNIIRTR